MKQALGGGLGSLALVSALVAAFAWAPWESRTREHEQEWLRGYVAWNAEIDRALESGLNPAAVGCEQRLRTLAGASPPRLARAMDAALEECRALRRSVVDDPAGQLPADVIQRWSALRSRVAAELVDARAASARLRRVPLLAERAAPLAERKPRVLCWPDSDWRELNEDWAQLRTDEFWAAGFADLEHGRIHLAPEVCDPLQRFFGGNSAPNLNIESFELAEALVTLAHEAEHLRSPRAPEADVECVAIQRVRDLVRDAGRARSYADLMTGLAWDVGYPDMPPEYRTTRCRDGSRLDVRPGSTVWP